MKRELGDNVKIPQVHFDFVFGTKALEFVMHAKFVVSVLYYG